MQAYMAGTALTSLTNLKKNSSMEISLAGCDFQCRFCDKLDIVDFKQEYLVNVLDIKREINEVSDQIDTIFFSGCEGGLQRQALLTLSRHAKNIGLQVGLKTNGTKPETIKSLLNENLLDFVYLNMFSDLDEKTFEIITMSSNFFKTTSSIIENVKESIELLKKNDVFVNIKTTLVKGYNDDINLILRIGSLISDFCNAWILSCSVNEKFEQVDRLFLEKAKIAIEEKYPHLIVEVISPILE